MAAQSSASKSNTGRTISPMSIPESEIKAAISALARAIVDAHPEGEILLVGILTSGVPLAHRLHHIIGSRTKVGSIDIGLYRDDAHLRLPQLLGSEIPFDVNEAHVVLVDDVVASGRTVRAAIDHLMDYGRPAKVELAVLIDRGGRELPLQPDFAGIRLGAGEFDRVKTNVSPDGKGPDSVIVVKSASKGA